MTIWNDARNQHNLTLESDDFYISYLLPNAMTKRYGWGASDDESIGETALIVRDPWDCKILNGDFRKDYETVFSQGYEACLEVFNNNQDKRSSWSD